MLDYLRQHTTSLDILPRTGQVHVPALYYTHIYFANTFFFSYNTEYMDDDEVIVEFDVDRKPIQTIDLIKKEPERQIPSEYARYLIARGYAQSESKAYLELLVLTILCFIIALFIFVITPPKKQAPVDMPPPVIDFSTSRLREENL